MQTQTQSNGKGKGAGFPKSDTNPEGYDPDLRSRTMKGKERKGVGKKDSGGVKMVTNIEALQTKVPHLMKLLKDAESSATDWKEACNSVGEAAGLNAATVAKYIKARAGDNFEEQKSRVLQMALVFEEVAA